MDEQRLRPWNWCDRRCERCPLAVDCQVRVREMERHEEMKRQGIDPDDPGVSFGIALDCLREALQMLTAAAEEEGIDLEDAEPEEPSHDGVELYEAGLDYARSIEELCERADRGDEFAEEARLVAMIVAGKTARLMHALPVERLAIDREDTVLTLLLISQLEKQAAALVMALCAEWNVGLLGYRRARRNLRRLLDAHLEGVRRSEREFVDRMVMLGRAPSPFCVTGGPPLRAA